MAFERIERDYGALFNPDELRPALVLVSLYVLAFESFRDGAISHVRNLYWRGVDESGHKYDEDEYRAAILSRHRSPFRASLDWYREMGALDDADMASVGRLTKIRNRLVHELGKIIGTKKLAPDLENFTELIRVYRKLEVWQIVNIELAGDEDWEGREIDEDEIIPGPIMMMRFLVEVALGKDDVAWEYHKAWQKHAPPTEPDAGAAT